MLTFAVFDDQGPAEDPPLRHAHLLGGDNIVAPGRIRAERGLIRCQPQEQGSAALALQWDAGPLGALTLQTTLLPHRDRPYLLSLELARHRIMLFFVKLEEWGEFALPAEHPAIRLFEQARAKFTQALVAELDAEGRYTLQQDALAREALNLAIDAGERLALHSGDRRLRERVGAESVGAEPNSGPQPNAAPSRPAIGAVVHSEYFTQPLQRVVADSFDFITTPMRWLEMEPEEGAYSFQATDRWIEWAVRKARLPVVGGPLVEFRQGCAPEWLYIWENDYDTLRELVYEHVKRVVTRYRRAVSRWIVVSGLHVASNFNFSLEQLVDLTRICVLLVRKLQPRARIEVEIAQPFGEYAASAPHALAPQIYADLISRAGVAVDAFGLQLQVGDVAPGRATRDMMVLSDLLDRYAEFQKPLTVTAMGAPSEPPTDEASGEGEVDPGHWRAPWSESAQSEWMTNAMTVALGKPFVRSICWQALYDTTGEADMHAGGLVTRDGRSKPGLSRLAEIRRRLHNRRSLEDLLITAKEPAAIS